jgi:pyrroline-5-carboxylate reductase
VSAPIGFIGTGTITEAMVRGLNASALRDRPILLSPRNAETAERLARMFPGVEVATSNQEVADRSSCLILAVRPQIAEGGLRALKLGDEHRVISLVAGLDHGAVAAWTGAGAVCRAIPLPFIAEGRDVTPVFPPDPQALALFNALGRALPVVDLSAFNALAALSALMGSFFGIAQIAADWGARQGLPPEQARHYVGQLFGNLGDVLRADPQSMVRLREEHSTRGGLNERNHPIEAACLTAGFRAKTRA